MSYDSGDLKSSDNRQVWSMLRPAVMPYFWGYVLVVFVVVIISLITVADPVIYGHIIDIIVDSLRVGDTSSLISDVSLLLWVWVGMFFSATVLRIGLNYFLWYLNNLVALVYSRNSIRRMLEWNQQRFSNSSSGEMLKIFDDAWNAILQTLEVIFNHIFPVFITFIFVLVAGFSIDWRLTLVSLIMLPISVIIGVYSWKNAMPHQYELGKEWSLISRSVGETISNITTIQNFVQEGARERDFISRMKKVTLKQLKLNVFWSLLDGVGNTMSMVARICVFGFGIVLVADGSLSLGVMVTFLGLLNYLLTPIQYVIADALPQVSTNLNKLKLMAEQYHLVEELVDAEDASNFVLRDGEIEFAGVDFSYDGNSNTTLKDIDLVIAGGTSCAIVGPSGAGKSTLVKLINRSVDPSGGVVSIDGQDLRGLKLRTLRRKIGVVSQDTLLFHDSIRNNVRFARPGATNADVEAACRKAEAHNFIVAMDKGYKSVVGERGVKLSGGERQRIALARIFLADPPILILDESTSALDSETESSLQETLNVVMEGRTTVLIAHRLSTIYLADQIVVMDGGEIVDSGTHDELTRRGGLYDRLWRLQSGGYID